jgi:hypothetical protein
MSAESQVITKEISVVFVSPSRQMQGYKAEHFKTDSFHIPSVSSFTYHAVIDFIKPETPTAS